MADRVAQVRLPLGDRPHLFDQRLELAATDVLQVHAVGAPGRGLVKVNRNSQLVPDLLPQPLGEPDTVLQRYALDGNERHDIRRPDAWVGSLMPGQVDQRHGLLD
jgi:hypothetical protein